MPQFSQQAIDLTNQFLGQGGSASQPGAGGFPRGINVDNMRQFGQTPAGQAIKNHVTTEVQRRRQAYDAIAQPLQRFAKPMPQPYGQQERRMHTLPYGV